MVKRELQRHNESRSIVGGGSVISEEEEESDNDRKASTMIYKQDAHRRGISET